MKRSREEVTLWVVVLGLPLVFLTDVQVSYSLMEFVCTRGQTWPLYLSSVVAIALMIAGGVVGRESLRQRARHDRSTSTSPAFLALGGVAFCGLFLVAELSLVVVKIFLVRC